MLREFLRPSASSALVWSSALHIGLIAVGIALARLTPLGELLSRDGIDRGMRVLR